MPLHSQLLKAKCCTLCSLCVCLSVHLFAYLYLPVSTKIYTARVYFFNTEEAPSRTVCPSTPNYWRLSVVLYVHCVSVCLSIYLHTCICLYLLRFTQQEFIFQYRIGSISDCVPLHSQLPQDCLPCGLSDSVLLLLPPMAELSYHSNNIVLLMFKKGGVSYSLFTTVWTC